jgi:hypothetical protein
MSGTRIQRLFLVTVILMAGPFIGKGNDGLPHHHFKFSQNIFIKSFLDSVPDQTQVIKEVPKSRKQAKPVAIPAVKPIKPLPIIKPKIIKPVIKVH